MATDSRRLSEARVSLTMTNGELAALDAYCAADPECPPRAAIIRRAVREWLDFRARQSEATP